MRAQRRRKTNILAVALTALASLIPAISPGKVEVYFNSQERLEKHLKGAFSKAVERAIEGKQGTIDIMIFSFTRNPLADSMLRIARDFPNVRIRILANLSQLFREPYSVLPDMEDLITGDKDAYRRVAERRKSFITDEEQKKEAVDAEFKYLVSEFRQKPMPNVEIKYKWFPSFSWINERGKATSYKNEGECGYDHYHQKSALLHHKTAIVNGEILVNGSYNWSRSAETKNFENLMVITGPEEQDLKLVTDFHEEFKAMWNDPDIAKTSDECRRLKDEICEEVVRERDSYLKAQVKE